jgi:hypothetical protein
MHRKLIATVAAAALLSACQTTGETPHDHTTVDGAYLSDADWQDLSARDQWTRLPEQHADGLTRAKVRDMAGRRQEKFVYGRGYTFVEYSKQRRGFDAEMSGEDFRTFFGQIDYAGTPLDTADAKVRANGAGIQHTTFRTNGEWCFAGRRTLGTTGVRGMHKTVVMAVRCYPSNTDRRATREDGLAYLRAFSVDRA